MRGGTLGCGEVRGGVRYVGVVFLGVGRGR